MDASAILAWLFDEPGANVVDQLIDDAALSTVSLAEVLYRCDEEGMVTGTLERDLRGLGIAIEPFTAADARIVADVRRVGRRARARVSLGDCCCIATGVRMQLPIVTGDRAWERLKLGVDIRPFR